MNIIYHSGNAKSKTIHPPLNPLPSREGRYLESPRPLRERVRVRGMGILATFLFALLFCSQAYAASITYTYDGLNRLKKADYGNGTYIEYSYDAAGNIEAVKTEVYTISSGSTDTTPPTTTATPAGGTYTSAQSVALTCSDGTGSGCDKIYYSTDGSTPSTIYTGPISISTTMTLKFFAVDLAENQGSVKTELYTIDAAAPVFTSTSPQSNSFINTANVGYALSQEISSGDDLTIDIKANNISSGVYGTAFNVDFDSSEITYESYTNGSFLEQGGNSASYQVALQSNNSGKLVVGISRQGSVSGVSGSGVLITLKFRVEGSSSISFSENELRDSSNQTISGISWYGGTVNVE